MHSREWQTKLVLQRPALVALLAAATVVGMASAGTGQAITVSILLRPDDPPPATVAPRSSGMIPVGVLSADGFDARTLSPPTLRLGPTGTEASPFRVAQTDVDRDGDIDLQVLFAVPDTGVTCEDTMLRFSGRTADGQEVTGSAPIVTEC